MWAGEAKLVGWWLIVIGRREVERHPTLVFLTLELKNTFISFERSYTNHVCSEACEACEAVLTLRRSRRGKRQKRCIINSAPLSLHSIMG
jgi:hypothetical protein